MLDRGELRVGGRYRRRCAVFADDRRAVVVSHDKDFTKRRIANTFGQHVRLACDQPDAVDVLEPLLDDLLVKLEAINPTVLIVSREGVAVRGPHWR